MSDTNLPEVDDLQTADPTHPSTGAAGGGASSTSAMSPSSDASTKDVAADEAKSVAQDARAGGERVAQTVQEQAGDVLGEARTQAREVYAQAKEELAGHAADQHRRAGHGLHDLADELRGMVDSSGRGGLATDLAGQAAGRVSALAEWFDGHEPGDVLVEARSVARRRPGAFLAGAAILGLVAGRLTRSGVDEARADQPEATAPEHTAYGHQGSPEGPAEPLPVAGTGWEASATVAPAEPDKMASPAGTHGLVDSSQERPS